MDTFSKLVWLYALRKATANAILSCLVNKYFVEIESPEKMLSDNGPQFCSLKYVQGMSDRGIRVVYTPVYYPQGNQDERANRKIGRLLAVIATLTTPNGQIC